MPTGLWGGGSAGKSSGTRRLFRQDATKLDGTSGSRLDSTREILVDERRGEERRGAGAVRFDVWGSLAGCFSKIRARRREEREGLSNERERGWRTVGKKARGRGEKRRKQITRGS